MNELTTFDVVWMQRLGGGSEVLARNVSAEESLRHLEAAERQTSSATGGVVFLRPSGDVIAAVSAELARAREHHKPLNSAHEAYAVILEELDEFKIEVWKKSRERDLTAMRSELIQLAAMAVRAVEDLDL